MAKTITAMLVGIAIAEGAIKSVDDMAEVGLNRAVRRVKELANDPWRRVTPPIV
jgi:hypothetical protein